MKKDYWYLLEEDITVCFCKKCNKYIISRKQYNFLNNQSIKNNKQKVWFLMQIKNVNKEMANGIRNQERIPLSEDEILFVKKEILYQTQGSQSSLLARKALSDKQKKV